MRGLEPRLHLPYIRWPEADRRLWARALSGDDPFDDAPGARLAKATQPSYLFAWRRFLGFLAISEPAALRVAPSERLTPDRVRQFVAHLTATNRPRSVANTVTMVYLAARMMMPDCDWSWLTRIKARLYAAAPANGVRGPVITSVGLLDLGQQMMDESNAAFGTGMKMRDAIRFRDGLMIAMIAFMPIRRKNLASLEIGRHLFRDDGGWQLVIPDDESKTGTPIEFAAPELLLPYLTTYLEHVRPQLLGSCRGTALWVSSTGGALCYGALGQIVGRRSMDRLGFRITLHNARHAAATTWAIASPDRIGAARDLLAHSELRTTTRYYNRAKGIEASRLYNNMISELRRTRTRKIKPAARSGSPGRSYRSRRPRG